MAPPQAITVLDPLPWSRSTVTRFALSELVNGGQLASNVDGQPEAWIVPPATDREPNPPHGYVVSVTPVFPKKTKCKPICMPGSSFMRIVDISE
jgi:hypothetical protein